MPDPSFYWYDYETFGADPRRDRPAQFAGLRTDLDLNPIGDPLTLYCRPAPDFLPQPEACLITGITPQRAAAEGIPEVRFMAAILREFSVPATCVAGYNNLRFDDELTRHSLYRNLFDPYGREWQNGNSRWDLIDVLRLTRALRPEGINWPDDAAGKPSFRLDLLTQANGIPHAAAHDALADVEATIALARLVRERQPRLFRYVFEHRGKAEVRALLGLGTWQPVLHASEKFPAERCCTTVVVALAQHPTNSNGVVTYDLTRDPTPLLTGEIDSLRRWLYAKTDELPHGAERPALKTVHVNKCPVLAPLKALRPEDGERLGIDLARCREHLDALRAAADLNQKVQAIIGEGQPLMAVDDPDLMLYCGGFLGDDDRRTLDRLRESDPADRSQAVPEFADPRLPELWFRFRARNFPETLSPGEVARWEAFRRRRLTDPTAGASITIGAYRDQLSRLQQRADLSEAQHHILAELWAYPGELGLDSVPAASRQPAAC